MERTSGNSRSRSKTHFRVGKRAARREEDIGREEDNKMAGELVEKLLKTF